MKVKAPIEIKKIINKCEGNSMEIREVKACIALKDYTNLRKLLKEYFGISSQECTLLIKYYKNKKINKRKFVDISKETLEKDFEKIEFKLKESKEKKDDNLYDEALGELYEEYIAYFGDIMITSSIVRENGKLCFRHCKELDESYVNIELADQIFKIGFDEE
jgi:hypothetical protein